MAPTNIVVGDAKPNPMNTVVDFLSLQPNQIFKGQLKSDSDIVLPEDLQFSNNDGNEALLEEAQSVAKRRNGIMSSKGEYITNMSLDVSLVAQKKEEFKSQLKDVKDYLGDTNIYVELAQEKYEDLNELLESLCRDQKKTKRFIAVLIISLLVSITITAGTLAIKGAMDAKIDKEILDLSSDKLKLEKERDEIMLENDLKIQNQNEEIRKELDEMKIQRKWEMVAIRLHHAMKKTMDELLVFVDPHNHFRGPSHLMNRIHLELGNRTSREDFSEFGISGVTTALTLSITEPAIYRTDDTCQNSMIRTKYITVSPNSRMKGLPTEHRNKFEVAHSKYMWINQETILPGTSYRPENTLSRQRTILTDHTITQVYPYNNTLLFLESDEKLLVTYICQDVQKSYKLFKNPILIVQLGCEVISEHLNISLYSIDQRDELIDLQDDPLLHHENFAIYHPEMDNGLDESKARRVINQIFHKGEGILQKEKEKIQSGLDFGFLQEAMWKVGNWMDSMANKIIVIVSCVIGLVVMFFVTYIGIRAREFQIGKMKEK